MGGGERKEVAAPVNECRGVAAGGEERGGEEQIVKASLHRGVVCGGEGGGLISVAWFFIMVVNPESILELKFVFKQR